MDATTLAAEIANALHTTWCTPECDSWDGRNCESYYADETVESATAVMAVVRPYLTLED